MIDINSTLMPRFTPVRNILTLSHLSLVQVVENVVRTALRSPELDVAATLTESRFKAMLGVLATRSLENQVLFATVYALIHHDNRSMRSAILTYQEQWEDLPTADLTVMALINRYGRMQKQMYQLEAGKVFENLYTLRNGGR